MAMYRCPKGSGGVELVPWATGTDEQIKAMVDAYYDGTLSLADIQSVWHIGDERTINLSAMSATGGWESHVAQSVKMVIMNFGGKKLSSDHTTDVLAVIGQKNCLANGTNTEYGFMRSNNSNVGGWESCPRRSWLNSTYKNAIPSAFSQLFKLFDNKASAGNKQTKMVFSSDYFAFPARVEVDGTTSAYSSEGTQFAYYVDSSHWLKYAGDSGVGSYNIWWLRSPCMTNNDSFLTMANASGQNVASAQRGISPFGCI